MRGMRISGPGHRRGATRLRPTSGRNRRHRILDPFAGAPGYERLAPTQVASPGQLNEPLGQPRRCRGDRGMRPNPHQYERSSPLFRHRRSTHTVGPGQLRALREHQRIAGESGQRDAPTRQWNSLIAPSGYVGTWLRSNGATHTLIALYRSAYTVQAIYGFASQQMSGAAQLVTNTKGVCVRKLACRWHRRSG
jgi:hypothetical protein